MTPELQRFLNEFWVERLEQHKLLREPKLDYESDLLTAFARLIESEAKKKIMFTESSSDYGEAFLDLKERFGLQ